MYAIKILKDVKINEVCYTIIENRVVAIKPLSYESDGVKTTLRYLRADRPNECFTLDEHHAFFTPFAIFYKHIEDVAHNKKCRMERLSKNELLNELGYPLNNSGTQLEYYYWDNEELRPKSKEFRIKILNVRFDECGWSVTLDESEMKTFGNLYKTFEDCIADNPLQVITF